MLVPCLPRDGQPLGPLSPPLWGCACQSGLLVVSEVGVTDSDFFTQDDPYQGTYGKFLKKFTWRFLINNYILFMY